MVKSEKARALHHPTNQSQRECVRSSLWSLSLSPSYVSMVT